MNVVASRCQYTVLENGIHKFTWYDPSQVAVDEWINQLKLLYETAEHGGALRCYHRLQAHRLPAISYVCRSIRELESAYPARPRMRTVVLHHSAVTLNMLSGVAQAFNASGYDRTCFYTPDQKEQAIAWLLADY
jgi:hypothetical protein